MPVLVLGIDYWLAESGVIGVWGDGDQTRSYSRIHDCVKGIYRLLRSGFRGPLNLGQDRMVTIDEMVDIVTEIAGKRIFKQYALTKPQDVRAGTVPTPACARSSGGS